jgi:hypothetical protein
MIETIRCLTRSMLTCALFCNAASHSQASTIIKLPLGVLNLNISPDFQMVGGVLSTRDEGPTLLGDQQTTIGYLGLLKSIPDDVNGSFTLQGLTLDGPATVSGNVVIQNFKNGSFTVYDAANHVVLQGPLTQSALTGVIGPPGTGALFTTTLGIYTGGSVTPFINQGTVSLSINLTNVNDGNGFVTASGGGGLVLQDFSAEGAVSIAALPEPCSATLLGLAIAGLSCGVRRRI